MSNRRRTARGRTSLVVIGLLLAVLVGGGLVVLGADVDQAAERRQKPLEALFSVTKRAPGKEAVKAKVSCPSDSGAICRSLGELLTGPDPDLILDPNYPAGIMCTQQYEGSERYHVYGMVAGERVALTRGLTNGCEIAQSRLWEKLFRLATSGRQTQP